MTSLECIFCSCLMRLDSAAGMRVRLLDEADLPRKPKRPSSISSREDLETASTSPDAETSDDVLSFWKSQRYLAAVLWSRTLIVLYKMKYFS